MTLRTTRSRSGITLVEILISILILGVGVISLATLFPIGLVRLRKAQQLTRGGFLVEGAIADLGNRNLLSKNSFVDPTQSPWFQRVSINGTNYDPWIQDTPAYGLDPNDAGGAGIGAMPLNAPTSYVPPGGILAGPGLPVAYDPFWRYVTGSYPDFNGSSSPEGRFGSGIGFVRSDPGGGTASSHGLQRLSNLQSNQTNSILPQFAAATWMPSAAYFTALITQNGLSVIGTFVSPEDMVTQVNTGKYQDPNAAAGVGLVSPSTVVPDLSGGSQTYDWRFTWFFTGRQADVSDGSVFDGDIVICENRPFAIDTVTSPQGLGNVSQPAGETVVEAVWGYSSAHDASTFNATSNQGYASPAARRSVLLRWPVKMADPDVRVGGWIADTTYERTFNLGAPFSSNTRFGLIYPGQRCNWYQVVKRSDPEPDPGFTGDPATTVTGGYRRMTVWVSGNLKAMSLLNFPTTAGQPANPVHVETALIMPSVVQVYPQTIYSR